MMRRKLREGTVWDKANGKGEFRVGILEKQARDGKCSRFRGRLQHKQKQMEVSWLEWRSCTEMF